LKILTDEDKDFVEQWIRNLDSAIRFGAKSEYEKAQMKYMIAVLEKILTNDID
jgi:hypothetical protein